ncbi:hypothetical protein IAQ61_011461 [Plenodomus lingam]|uniref:uncharacterized protein n=1 Tax=Leptosphaeria maculans TaxID=5022 RepID=UPI003321752B|nr:hypothetical protein IAQ61_011461 [Plenodomus lingam]
MTSSSHQLTNFSASPQIVTAQYGFKNHHTDNDQVKRTPVQNFHLHEGIVLSSPSPRGQFAPASQSSRV